MTDSPATSRTPRLFHFTLPLLSLALLSACTDPGTGNEGESTGDTGETGDVPDQSSCADAGSELLPDLKPVLDPNPQQSPAYTCSSGWATDAPMLEPTWTKQIGGQGLAYSNNNIRLAAHPSGGVIMAGAGALSHYSTAGDQTWTLDVGLSQDSQYFLTVDPGGTITLGIYDWNVDQLVLDRYAGDGTLIGPVGVNWTSPYANIWALDTFGDDLVVGAFDEDEQGFYEAVLLRLDPADNVVLRKSTSMTNGQLLAVNDAGVAMFGIFPTFLVSIDNGAVLGTWAPSNGGVSQVVGYGDDFVMTGNSGDLSLGRYSGTGSERWLQTYDRATLGDQGTSVAVAGDGTIVTVGSTQLLNFSNSYWFGSQPLVVASDADGNALWTDRMAGHGFASSVAIGSAGEVYVTGVAELDGDPNVEDPMVLRFLRMYEP